MNRSATAPPAPSHPREDRPVTMVRLRRSLLAAIPDPAVVAADLHPVRAACSAILNGPLPGGADSILYSWYFKEIQVSLWSGHSPFFTTAMNAPTGLNIMWNTAIILPAFLMTPITAAFGATTSVGLLMIAAPLAAAGICYWVLHKLTGHLAGSPRSGRRSTDSVRSTTANRATCT